MKKTILIFVLTLFNLSAFSQVYGGLGLSYANFKAFTNYNYSKAYNKVGLNLKLGYATDTKFGGGFCVDYNKYFTGRQLNFAGLDFVGHAYLPLSNNNNSKIYPLLGVGYGFLSNDRSLWINTGLGFKKKINELSGFYIEGKYLIHKYRNPFVVNVSLYFLFKRRSKVNR